MNLRSALAMLLMLVLVVCSASAAGCTVRCAAGAAGGQDSCHADTMSGMTAAGGSVSLSAPPVVCAGHDVAVNERITTQQIDGTLPVAGVVAHSLRVVRWCGPPRVVPGVESSSRLRIPLRV